LAQEKSGRGFPVRFQRGSLLGDLEALLFVSSVLALVPTLLVLRLVVLLSVLGLVLIVVVLGLIVLLVSAVIVVRHDFHLTLR